MKQIVGREGVSVDFEGDQLLQPLFTTTITTTFISVALQFSFLNLNDIISVTLNNTHIYYTPKINLLKQLLHNVLESRLMM